MSQCRRQNSNKCHCQAQKSQEKTWDMQWQAILGLGFCIAKQIPANPGSICARPNGTSTACIVENFGVKASRFQDCWRKRIESTNPARSTVCPVCVPYMAGCQPVGIIAFGQLFWTEPCMHTWHPQLWHKEAGQKDWQPPGHCISAPNVCMVDSSNLNEPSELQHFMLSSLLIQMPWCQLIELWSHHNVSATLAFEPNHFLYNFCLGPLQKPMSSLWKSEDFLAELVQLEKLCQLLPAMVNPNMVPWWLLSCCSQFSHDWMHGILQGTAPVVLYHLGFVPSDQIVCPLAYTKQEAEAKVLLPYKAPWACSQRRLQQVQLFSFCQLFKALNPASCFQKTKIQEISHSMALNLYCKKHFHTHQNVVLHVSKTYKN